MTTLKAFIASQPQIEPALIRAVVKACGGWVEFKEKAGDVTTYGCQSGVVSELIYYADTFTFTKKYRPLILSLACEFMDECGDDLLNVMIKHDTLRDCTKGEITKALLAVQPKLENNIECLVFNWLAWWACEYVAYAYIIFIEQ